MSYLLDQIAVEKQRIAVFESKIEKCKNRIESLEFLIQDSDDELDTLASNTIVTAKQVTLQQKLNSGENFANHLRRRPISDKSRLLLEFIGKDGKALKDVVVYAKANNLGMTDINIRNFAMIYRKRYGFIENPHPGFYRLTETGINVVINSHLEALQSETPTAGNVGVSYKSTQAAEQETIHNNGAMKEDSDEQAIIHNNGAMNEDSDMSKTPV